MAFWKYVEMENLDKSVLYAHEVLGELRKQLQTEYDRVKAFMNEGEKKVAELKEEAGQLRTEVAELKKEREELKNSKPYPRLGFPMKYAREDGTEYYKIRVFFCPDLPGREMDISRKVYNRLGGE